MTVDAIPIPLKLTWRLDYFIVFVQLTRGQLLIDNKFFTGIIQQIASLVKGCGLDRPLCCFMEGPLTITM